MMGCNKKKAFLDEKPSTDVFIPKTITDLQAILDNDLYLNEIPELGTLSGDEYYMMPDFWETLGAKEQNSYIWASDIFEGQGKVADWNLPYKQVFYANVVLEEIGKGNVINASRQELDNVQGAALFVRSFAFYNIAQHFAGIYDDASLGTRPGIPLRLLPEIDEKTTRATLKETYDQIINDLKKAIRLLPDSLPYLNRNRPSKPAAYAALARICLGMRSYANANLYADSCLKYYSKIIDYNSINQSSFLPFTPLNNETIYQARLLTASRVVHGVKSPGCIIDSTLYRSYEPNDLRKPIYFIINADNLPNIKGGYTGSILTFGGLAVDEVMLIRAECLAREKNTEAAMSLLNTLLENRFVKDTYVPRQAGSSEEALQLILEERKRELVFRGVRWTDLRRLNKEGRNITLTRKLNGKTYNLAPNDIKYILPIPPDVISLSGIEQNIR